MKRRAAHSPSGRSAAAKARPGESFHRTRSNLSLGFHLAFDEVADVGAHGAFVVLGAGAEGVVVVLAHLDHHLFFCGVCVAVTPGSFPRARLVRCKYRAILGGQQGVASVGVV